jgi:hypothetical protein
VRILKAFLRRLTGSDIRALRAEVAELKATHAQIAEVVMNLNHDIRSGSEASLPLFLSTSLGRSRMSAERKLSTMTSSDKWLTVSLSMVASTMMHSTICCLTSDVQCN